MQNPEKMSDKEFEDLLDRIFDFCGGDKSKDLDPDYTAVDKHFGN